MRLSPTWTFVLLGVPLVFLVAFFLVPFAVVAVASLQPEGGGEGLTLAHYTKVLADSYHWDVMFATLRISLWAVFASFVLGYPLAWLMVRVVRSRALRRALFVLTVIPLFTSNIVRAFGWMVLLGRNGLVNKVLLSLGLVERPVRFLTTEFGIVIGLTYILLPFMVLTIATTLQGISRNLEEASADLGATRVQTFLRVTLPLSIPGVVAGSLMVFALAVSAYVTPSLLSGGRLTVMSILIFQQYSTVFNFHYGAALAVTLLVTALAMMAGYLWFMERRSPGAAVRA
jgi:putative spermidine/putrescine transport system permease protein